MNCVQCVTVRLFVGTFVWPLSTCLQKLLNAATPFSAIHSNRICGDVDVKLCHSDLPGEQEQYARRHHVVSGKTPLVNSLFCRSFLKRMQMQDVAQHIAVLRPSASLCADHLLRPVVVVCNSSPSAFAA